MFATPLDTLVATPSTSNPLTPLPSAYHLPGQAQADMMADFFGARTRSTESPPAYSPHGDTESLPAYSEDGPTSLARYMFMYGFLFPPFWLMGIAILLSPLRTPADWGIDKTEEERATVLKHLRAEEVKWAKKCLWATLVLLVVLGLVGVAIYLAKTLR